MSTPIAADCVVSLSYTLTVAGNQLEQGDIDYLHGHGNIVPGLESGLEGATVGESRAVEVPPGLGYGERLDDAMQQVPRGMFPPGMEVAQGMRFLANTPDGQRIPVYVMHVDDETVIVDANHPLAGATLNFDVTIRAVRAATAEEIAHGHPHGADGHDHSHGH